MFGRFKTFSIERLERFLSSTLFKRELGEMLVYVFIAAYTVVFSYYTILKYNAFRAYAWDLGIFNQALWTTLHDGKLFHYTVELFVNPSGNFFGSHFSPILFLVLPPYYLHPAPETLLIFQSFILALGALPLYYFTRETLNHRTAAVAFALTYLIYPPLHGVNWFDFHVQAFLPVLFFSAMYFLKKEKWLPYFVFILLSLSVAENVPFVVVFIGFYCFWLYRKQVVQTVKERNFSDKRVLIPILTIAIAVFWFFLALWIKNTYFPINPDYSSFYKGVDNWSVLGLQDDPAKLPLYIIAHPWKALDALTYDTYLKLVYIILLFGPLQFLSFKSGKTIIAFVWLGPALLSNYPPYYLIGSHWPAYVIAFIFLAAVEAVSDKTDKHSASKLNSYLKNILVLNLLFSVFISPLSPLLTTFRSIPPSFSDYYPPSITDHELMLQTIVNHIPKTASVLTQNNIFPHFSSRTNAFVYPIGLVLERTPPDKMDKYLNNIMQNSEYALVDNVTDSYTASLVIDRIENNQTHGLYFFADGIYLFKRDYRGPPVFYIPEKYSDFD
ncbi:DUF2079 domain-containing protein [Candidatus Bathyarchaeota archaeon]|nr:DUF2079 domain-containing protein [Candidatus Bathyarchaeota archaeon]